jgi:hypothetical protein
VLSTGPAQSPDPARGQHHNPSNQQKNPRKKVPPALAKRVRVCPVAADVNIQDLAWPVPGNTANGHRPVGSIGLPPHRRALIRQPSVCPSAVDLAVRCAAVSWGPAGRRLKAEKWLIPANRRSISAIGINMLTCWFNRLYRSIRLEARICHSDRQRPDRSRARLRRTGPGRYRHHPLTAPLLRRQPRQRQHHERLCGPALLIGQLFPGCGAPSRCATAICAG